jgi:flagellar motor switch protein FliG
MAKFRGGVIAAAKMLAGLEPLARQKVLAQIAKKDPQMAQALEKSMVRFEDLKLVSVKQMQDLLREVSLADIALGLRASSRELKDHFYQNLPKRLCQDLDDVLMGPPRPIDQVLEAQEKVLAVMRKKVSEGLLVLRESDDDPLV